MGRLSDSCSLAHRPWVRPTRPGILQSCVTPQPPSTEIVDYEPIIEAAIAAGCDPDCRPLLRHAASRGRLNRDVLRIGRAIKAIDAGSPDGRLPADVLLEALQYGSIDDLRHQAEHGDPEMASVAGIRERAAALLATIEPPIPDVPSREGARAR